MKKLIILFILLLFGISSAQRYDLIKWYRIYAAEGYLNSDSTEYMEVDLRLYPPEHLFYKDTIMSKYPWKMGIKYHKRENVVVWFTECTITYGEWYHISSGCMFLKTDSLRKENDIVWRRQKGDKTKNSYFLFDYGMHYILKIYDLKLGQFIDMAGFLKRDKKY